MFAGAARGVVFSHPDVIKKIREGFIPVAIKAASVQNPPRGAEGEIYAEIRRTGPAPQGICLLNADGKPLDWALSFDDDKAMVAFFEYARKRFEENRRGAPAVRRYMNYPSNRLDDRDGDDRAFELKPHDCIGAQTAPRGTFLGRIAGQSYKNGERLKDDTKQENYMEDRFEIDPRTQEKLFAALEESEGKIELPREFGRAIVQSAYMSVLDVDPFRAGTEADWIFHAERAEGFWRISGSSRASGGADDARGFRTDGRIWSNEVVLEWNGFLKIEKGRLSELALLAQGRHRLKWDNASGRIERGPDSSRLMMGHKIDLEGEVRFAVSGTLRPPSSGSSTDED